MPILEIKDGAQEMLLKGGSFSLCEKLFQKISDKIEIIFDTKAVQANYENLDSVVLDCVSDSKIKKFYCKKVIFAFSPIQLSQISFEPKLEKFELPKKKDIEGFNFFKTFFVFGKFFFFVLIFVFFFVK